MHHTHDHSLEGKNPAHQCVPPGNQGIVDDRPEGRRPQGSTVLLDTVVDPDASAENGVDHLRQSSMPGVTSRDVYEGIGVPVQGMSSRELRHDGQPGRKRQAGGVEQFGERVESTGGSGTCRVEGASEKRCVAGKTEFRGRS